MLKPSTIQRCVKTRAHQPALMQELLTGRITLI